MCSYLLGESNLVTSVYKGEQQSGKRGQSTGMIYWDVGIRWTCIIFSFLQATSHILYVWGLSANVFVTEEMGRNN